MNAANFRPHYCPRCGRHAMLRILPAPSTEEVCDACYGRAIGARIDDSGFVVPPPSEPVTPDAIYTRRRPDGWPLCPQCGADELYSVMPWGNRRPTLAEFMAAITGCYACRWRP